MPLGKNADAGDYVKDFQKSKAPQFKGKSKKKRQQMAIAAYLDSKEQKESKMNEGTPTKKQVKQAIGIARDKRYAKGNMTGAMKTMDKINKGLAQHPAVSKELKKQNEGKQVNEFLPAIARAGVKAIAKPVARAANAYAQKKVMDKASNEEKAASRDSLQKAIDVFKKRGGKIKKVAPGKAAGYHGKEDPGSEVHGMMDRGDTKAVGTRKKVKSMGEAKISTSQMGTLKKTFEPLKGKKLGPNAQNKLRKIMDKLGKDKDTLIQLVKADIPFVTQLAITRLISKHNMKAPEIKKLKEKTLDEAKQTHMFDNEKSARDKAKEIGGKYVRGIGKSAGKHAAIKGK